MPSPIGGTDIAAIMGVHPYKSAFDAWLRCTGQADSIPDNRPMRLGRKWQSVILEEYGLELQVPVIENVKDLRHVNSIRPYQGGTIDGKQENAPVGVDAKKVGLRQSHRWGEQGSDQVPEEILLQCLWYADGLDYEAWDVAALVGDYDFRVYRVQRNPRLEAIMREMAQEFWERHVLPVEPPAITEDSAGAREWLSRQHPKETSAQLMAAEPTDYRLLRRLEKRHAGAKLAAELLEKTKTMVIARIGDSAGIEWHGGKVTFKQQQGRAAMDWEALLKDHGIELTEEMKAKYSKRGAPFRVFRTTFNAE